MPKVSLTAELNSSGQMVQKGPATDYSMLLEMKKRQVMVTEANSRVATNGRKGDGIVVDDQHTRGSENGPAIPVLFAKGARLGFFKW